jgi:hypothetical protein
MVQLYTGFPRSAVSRSVSKIMLRGACQRIVDRLVRHESELVTSRISLPAWKAGVRRAMTMTRIFPGDRD